MAFKRTDLRLLKLLRLDIEILISVIWTVLHTNTNSITRNEKCKFHIEHPVNIKIFKRKENDEYVIEEESKDETCLNMSEFMWGILSKHSYISLLSWKINYFMISFYIQIKVM